MSNFIRVLKIIGRALRRFFCAIGRFFKFSAKKIAKNAKTGKLQKVISEKEKSIENLYSEIGRNYYDAHCDEPEELLSELVNSLTDDKNAIEESAAKIDALQEAYDAALNEAKDKAKARREADKAAAKADKARVNGEILPEDADTEIAAEPKVVLYPVPEPVKEPEAEIAEEVPVAEPELEIAEEVPAAEPEPEIAEEEPAAEPESEAAEEEPAVEPEPEIAEEEPAEEPEPAAAEEAPAEEPEPEAAEEAPAAEPELVIAEEPPQDADL